MRKFLLSLSVVAVAISLLGLQQKELDLWALFGKTRFVEKLNREFNMYFLYPNFSDELKALEGKEVRISGFYIPLDVATSDYAVLSKFPMAECFFCGGAGPETIVVGKLKTKPSRRIKTDEIITIRGKLKLNSEDVEEMNFILEEAVIVPN